MADIAEPNPLPSRVRGGDAVATTLVDALFVINQDTDPGALAALCERHRHQTLLILTTHHPFPPEAERLAALAREVQLMHFADLVGDEEAAACDDRATAECSWGRRGRSYNACFMASSLGHKNELAYRKLAQRHRFGAVHFQPGLGIHAPFWRSVGGSSLEPAGSGQGVARRAWRLASAAAARMRSWPGMAVVRGPADAAGAGVFVFLGSVRRLRLRDGCRVRPIEDGPLAALWGLAVGAFGLKLYCRLLRRAILAEVEPAPWELCTTVHEYRPRFSDLAEALGVELKIFVDGHHPSNYPRSYAGMFLSGTFVVANVASAAWFRRDGRRTCPPHAIQRSELFAECRCEHVGIVVLVNNHAGDWTSLINRSDSDLLIEAFARLAGRYPGLTFWIRLHPTMAHPDHEGTGSVERIRRYVSGLALPNLAISTASLEEDLDRGDLYLSEYSQVLVDAWRRGRLGFAVNLTGRRSFMRDFERFGFIGFTGFEPLCHVFGALPAELPDLVARQNRAVRRFNRLQRTWERRAG